MDQMNTVFMVNHLELIVGGGREASFILNLTSFTENEGSENRLLHESNFSHFWKKVIKLYLHNICSLISVLRTLIPSCKSNFEDNRKNSISQILLPHSLLMPCVPT